MKFDSTPRGIDHPTKDPALVSYHRPELAILLPQLEQAIDCWTLFNADGLGEAKAKYLPREPAEPKDCFEARLNRSTYTPIYRDAIRSYAGLLSRFQLIDPPSSLRISEKNVDLQGSSIQSFLTRVDEMALRDGGAYVMVDMMPDNGNDNFFDQQLDDRHPYLISIQRADVINWMVTYDNGRETLTQATVRQFRTVPDAQGAFGAKIEPVYFVLTPGKVEMYQVVKEGPSRWANKLVSSVATSMPVIPLVWYGATSPCFSQGDLPMDGLADLSIQHFQMRSDLNELLHKCAMPVPVRTGATIGVDGHPPALVLGPNTAVDLPAEGGSFSFAEPSGKSLQRHQEEIRHVEELMDRSSLNFLYGANIKTATEASLRASQVSSSVAALVRNKTAMFGSIMRLWAWYAGEQSEITLESGLSMNDSLINKPLGASEIAQIINLRNNKMYSTRTSLEELQRGGVVDPDLVIDDEMERIKEEEAQDLEKAHAEQEFQAQTPSQPSQDSKPIAEDASEDKAAQREQDFLEKAAEEAK